MISTIEELWYGNLAPCENCGAGDEEIERLTNLMCKNEEALRKDLAGNHKELFLQYVKWADHFACSIAALAFREGFSIATKLFMDSITGDS